MASKINNQATLSYTSGSENVSVASNIASVLMQGPVDVRKYSLETAYQMGDLITYHVFVTNDSDEPLANILITDDLGTYELREGVTVAPLTYVGPAKVFINDVYSQIVNGVVSVDGKSVAFTVAALDVGETLLLSYKAQVNQYAGAVIDTSKIINTVSVTADDMALPVTASNTLPVSAYADLRITKSMEPASVTNGSKLTYIFEIYNYGTLGATAVKLQDIFTPIPAVDTVYLNDAETTNYSYDPLTGEFLFPKTGAPEVSINSATYVQDPVTGIVTVTPTGFTLKVVATI